MSVVTNSTSMTARGPPAPLAVQDHHNFISTTSYNNIHQLYTNSFSITTTLSLPGNPNQSSSYDSDDDYCMDIDGFLTRGTYRDEARARLAQFLDEMDEAAAFLAYRRLYPIHRPVRTVFVPAPVYVVPSGPRRALHSARFNGGRAHDSRAPRSIASGSHHEDERDESRAGGASVASSARPHGTRSSASGHEGGNDRATTASRNSGASRSAASTARPHSSSGSNA
ncbi:uncharacterized protein BDZ99DRAFT_472592 [Mytilinidion resinicola]|uniref:Uncharacterized protein n=1 Tax=Mytilinidion resinicola TaxID=574789 RepID=A0A6A6Z3R5_9PEZI|nr:uncharacterized protein BDZ99DRAFT_472592 [Mytilinidion resinicola]KAF2815293.1 hypothetical protein BDZ99DRAFT_472592 [Mytilinidion resinicola]